MPNITQLELHASSGTPLFFQPQSKSGDTVVWVLHAVGPIAARPNLSIKYSPGSANRQTIQYEMRLNHPLLRDVNGENKVEHTCRFIGKWIIPHEASTDEVDDFVELCDSLTDGTNPVQAAMKAGEGFY